MRLMMAILATVLASIAVHAYAMYQGAEDWKAPKTVDCTGIADYPKGYSAAVKDVVGSSLDRYIFTVQDGAMGLWHFDLAHESPLTMPVKGTATYIETMDWKITHHKVACSFGY